MKSSANSLLVFACLLIAGCGDSGARVSGILLENGQPLTVKENEEITMSLVAADPDAKVALATVDYDPSSSTFAVQGPAQQVIPPGEYKIVIARTPYQETNADRFGGAFSAEKTPLRYTVTQDRTQEIVIDVKEQTVKRK